MTQEIGIRISWDGAAGEAGVKRLTQSFGEVGQSSANASNAAAASLAKVEMSAKQTAAALRGVPAQFTDIFTSLASGQSPMMVLMQQGGQLKDMFGGTGAAARALGGYVMGLVNPLTVGAATVAALAVAAHQGAEESRMLANALVLTGNAAGTSVSQLQGMSQSVAAAAGATKAAAADALAQLTGTGRVAADVLQQAAAASVSWERATGKAVADTVKEFAELGKAPVAASLKLNEQYNYLTLAVYQQIKALEDQGKASEAAALAQKTYADAAAEMAKKVTENLGFLEKGWRGVSDGAKAAWDGMLGIGRETSLEQKIANQVKYLQDLRNGAFYVDTTKAEEYLTQLQIQLEAQKRAAAAEAERTRVQREGLAAAQAVAKVNEKALSKQEQMNKALAEYRDNLAKIRAADPNHADLAPANIARGEKAIREQHADKAAESAAKRLQESYQSLIGTIREKAAAEEAAVGTTTNLSEAQKLQIKVTQDLASGKLKLTTAQKAVVDAELARLAALEQVNQREVEAAKLAKEHAEYLGKLADEETKRTAQLNASNEKLREEIDQLGMSAEQVAIYQAEKLRAQAATDLLSASTAEEQALLEEAAGVCTAASAAYRELAAAKRAAAGAALDQAGLVQARAAKKAAVDAASATVAAWKRAGDDIYRSLTDSLYRSFETGGSVSKTFFKSLENTAKATTLRIAVEGVFSLGGSLANAGINALLGTSSSNGGAGTNYLGMASNAQSAYSLYGLAANTFQYGAADTAKGLYYAAQNFFNPGPAASQYTVLTAAEAAASGAEAGYGLYASTSLASTAPGVAPVVGQMASGTGSAAAAPAGSTAGSMASLWPLAVIAGMYLSNSLYSAGYKYDRSTFEQGDYRTWSMAGQEAQYQTANTLGKLFGQDNFGDSRFFQVASGVNLSRYVDEAVQKALGIRGGGAKIEAFGGDRDVSWGLAKTAPTDDLLGGIAAGLETQFNGILVKFGKSAQDILVGLGMDADPLGDSKARMGYSLSVGGAAVFSERDVDAITFDAIQANANRALIAALQSADISEPVDAYLDSLGDVSTMTKDQITTTLGMIDTYYGLGKEMELLGINTDALTSTMVQAFGGTDALNTALQSYYQNFFTEEERAAKAREQLQAQFVALGYTMPTTRAGMKALIAEVASAGEESAATVSQLIKLSAAVGELADTAEQAAAATAGKVRGALQEVLTSLDNLHKNAADAATRVSESQRSIYDAYTSSVTRVSDAQAALNDLLDQSAQSTRDFAGSIADWLGQLQTSATSSMGIEARYQSLAAKLQSTATLAKAGDQDSRDKLTGVASAFLDASRVRAPSAVDYARDEARTRILLQNILGSLPATATAATTPTLEQQVAAAQQALADRQAEAAKYLQLMVDTGTSTSLGVQSVADEIAGLRLAYDQATTAQALANSQLTVALAALNQLGLTEETVRLLVAGKTGAAPGDFAEALGVSDDTISALQKALGFSDVQLQALSDALNLQVGAEIYDALSTAVGVPAVVLETLASSLGVSPIAFAALQSALGIDADQALVLGAILGISPELRTEMAGALGVSLDALAPLATALGYDATKIITLGTAIGIADAAVTTINSLATRLGFSVDAATTIDQLPAVLGFSVVAGQLIADLPGQVGFSESAQGAIAALGTLVGLSPEAQKTIDDLDEQVGFSQAAKDLITALKSQVGLSSEALATIGDLDDLVGFSGSAMTTYAALSTAVGMKDGVLSSLASSVGLSPAALAAISSISVGVSNSSPSAYKALVDSTYEMVLGRKAEEKGESYWLSQLYTGAVTAANFLPAFIAGASGTDKDTAIAYAKSIKLPGFAIGTSYVPTDMVAQIHAGEEITPRPYVDAQREQREETNSLLSTLLRSNRELRDEIALLKSQVAGVARSTDRTDVTLQRVTQGGRDRIRVELVT